MAQGASTIRRGTPTSGGPTAPARTGRRRLYVAVAIVLLIGGALVLRAWQGRDAVPTAAETSAAAAALDAASGIGADTPPPWPAPADPLGHVQAAGLQLGEMGTAEHYHFHLDVIVNGQPVPVPADLGVDPSTGAMSYLHTHTADGVVHIEAGRAGQKFTLGQLFTQWDVRLSATQLGGLRVDGANTLSAYVDGAKVTGDPAHLRVAPHQQIALVYGPADQVVDVPSDYAFAKGD